MNPFSLYSYTRHLVTARGTEGYGIHSPYMYHFITRVLGGRSNERVMKEVRSLRREMLSEREEVTVRDLGYGSACMRKPERRVATIARVAALPDREAGIIAAVAENLDTLLRIGEGAGAGRDVREGETDAGGVGGAGAGRDVRDDETDAGGVEGAEGERVGGGLKGVYQQQPVIVELGTSLGISTLALALAAPAREVITVEGSPALAEIAQQNLARHGAVNATVLCMEFSDALSHLAQSGKRVELAFIDGNHRGEALIQYVKSIKELGGEMIIIADDIRLNRQMNAAWRRLAAAESVSLETFRLGMLFAVQRLTPQHCLVRR